jgi:hypothetical protein
LRAGSLRAVRTRLAIATCLVAFAGPPAGQASASLRSDAVRLLELNKKVDRKLDEGTTKALNRLDQEIRNCAAGPGAAPASAGAEVQRRAQSLLFRHALAAVRKDLGSAATSFEKFRAKSATVRDAARAAARIHRIFRVLGKDPPSLCGYWEQWQAANWSASFRPDPPARNLTRAEKDSASRAFRTIQKAATKFRRSGIGKSKVSYFVDTYDLREVLGKLDL